MAKGWHRESRRHSLASRGVKTAVPKAEAMMKPKRAFIEKDLLDNVFFSKDLTSAKQYLKNNNVEYEDVKLNNEQLEHIDNWKTFKYNPKEKKYTKSWVASIEKKGIKLMDGQIPEGKVDMIYYYILEDANFHGENNILTKKGKYGSFETKKSSYGQEYYIPDAYAIDSQARADYNKYSELGGRTYNLLD